MESQGDASTDPDKQGLPDVIGPRTVPNWKKIRPTICSGVSTCADLPRRNYATPILALSGKLNLQKTGGNWVFPPLPPEVLATASRPVAGWPISKNENDHFRRSIYIHVKRSLRHQMLADFDQADTDSPCAVRFATTVPTQALTMLNSKFVNDQAALLAGKLEKSGGAVENRIKAGLRLASQREPTDLEVEHCLEFVKEMKAQFGLDEKQAMERFALMALNLNEFVYLD